MGSACFRDDEPRICGRTATGRVNLVLGSVGGVILWIHQTIWVVHCSESTAVYSNIGVVRFSVKVMSSLSDCLRRRWAVVREKLGSRESVNLPGP